MSRERLPTRQHRHRTRARAWALQVLYRWESVEEEKDPTEILEEVLHTRYVAPERREHLRRLVEAVEQNRTDVDGALVGALDNWRLDRLGMVERCILRLAAAELLFVEDVPERVAIQEAVRLAERYGSDDSARFVNGVLDALYRRARPTR